MKKCLILAGGRGVRLRPLTDSTPKTMALFKGKPILEYTLSILPEEIVEVFIITGWLGDKIKNYFGGSYRGIKINYLQQDEPRGTFHALSLAKEFLKDESFLIISGDDIYSKKDIKEINQRESAVLAHKTSDPERFGICVIGGDGQLLDIKEKPKEFVGNLANIGVYKIRPTIFDEKIIVGKNNEQVLAPMIGSLAKKERVDVVQASFWYPVADMKDLEEIQGLEIN